MIYELKVKSVLLAVQELIIRECDVCSATNVVPGLFHVVNI